ncbi:MAG: nucleotidyltransferase domain-containing protein [Clostridiales bacterium]|jgi:predicted nucleotidyltransferase|nr:nucleotidyltransferase domain-containing protein [Clostridiales bacterium]
MKTRIKLTQADKDHIIKQITTKLSFRPDVAFAYLHGSATGEQLIGDIDIAIYFKHNVTQDQQNDITLSLSMELSHELGLPVDVQPLNQTTVGFRFHVTEGRVLFSCDEDFRAEFVVSTWQEYHDFKPLMEQNLRDLLDL